MEELPVIVTDIQQRKEQKGSFHPVVRVISTAPGARVHIFHGSENFEHLFFIAYFLSTK